MRSDARLRRPTLILAPILLLATPARATECGDLRSQAATLRAAAAAEEQLASAIADATRPKHQATAREAAAAAKALDKKIGAACAPRKATIAALPLAYLTVAPGNASHLAVDPGAGWGLTLTTLAGAPHGIVFPDAATVAAPAGARWEVDAAQAEAAGGAVVVVATDAQLTVEEPAAGRGAWRIDLRGKPLLVGVHTLRACAAAPGHHDVGGAKLSPAACRMLLGGDPLSSPAAIPERGRAVLLGEWQYGDRAGFELADELADPPAAAGPPPRVDLALELSAAIPGVSDGKHLHVSAGANRKTAAAGTSLKLQHDCGEDAKCQETWFSVEVWYDRAFAAPLVRRRAIAAGATRVGGKVADRLERPIAGQRVVAAAGERRVLAISDPDGRYRFDGLLPGETYFAAVGRALGGKLPRDTRTVTLGASGAAGPKLLIDKLIE